MASKGSRGGVGNTGIGYQTCGLAQTLGFFQYGLDRITFEVDSQCFRRCHLAGGQMGRRTGRVNHHSVFWVSHRQTQYAVLRQFMKTCIATLIDRVRCLTGIGFQQTNLLWAHTITNHQNDVLRLVVSMDSRRGSSNSESYSGNRLAQSRGERLHKFSLWLTGKDTKYSRWSRLRCGHHRKELLQFYDCFTG